MATSAAVITVALVVSVGTKTVVSWLVGGWLDASFVLDWVVVRLGVGLVVLGSGTCNWKSPGFVGLMNGSALGMLSYCSSVSTKARYPSCPPPSVVGTHWAFRFTC